MTKFRKKPVVIEAMQFTLPMSALELHRFCGEKALCVIRDDVISISITTLEGEMLVSPGDWIIKGTEGEFYRCKPDIFEATYEAV